MTNPTNRSKNIVKDLIALQNQREKWENGAYKTSNAGLYRILASCLDLYQQLQASDERKARKDLTDRLTELGFKLNEGTSLATKVVRFVFKTDRKRSHAYSRVILSADQHNIDPLSLPNWIDEQGGIEEVRKKASSGLTTAQRTTQCVGLAEEELENTKALVPSFNATAELRSDATGTRAYSLAVVRTEKDGRCSIVYGINKGALLKQALAQIGRTLLISKAQSEADIKSKDNKQKRSDAIKSAA